MRLGRRRFAILRGPGELSVPWVSPLRGDVILTCLLIRDAFAGGFVAGIVEGKSLEESVDMGQWLASLSITELGPSYVKFSSLLIP